MPARSLKRPAQLTGSSNNNNKHKDLIMLDRVGGNTGDMEIFIDGEL